MAGPHYSQGAKSMTGGMICIYWKWTKRMENQALSCPVMFSWKGGLEGMEGDRARGTKVMINIYESRMIKDSRTTKPQNKTI